MRYRRSDKLQTETNLETIVLSLAGLRVSTFLARTMISVDTSYAGSIDTRL
jgi:hypothetical protein